MGLYDSIIYQCPKCRREVVAQTKSGACLLRYFKLLDAPEDVLDDVNRHAPYTCECGVVLSVHIPSRSVWVEGEPEPSQPDVTSCPNCDALGRKVKELEEALRGFANIGDVLDYTIRPRRLDVPFEWCEKARAALTPIEEVKG